MAFSVGLNRKEPAQLPALRAFLTKCAIGMLALAALTGAALLLHANLATVGLLYLLTIVLAALQWGFALATVLSVVAVVCQCYFFVPPIHTFFIADAQNYFALAVFEFSALLVSRLSAREQNSARDAGMQRNNAAMLYELSRKTLQLDPHKPPGSQLVLLVKEIFSVDAVAIFDLDLDTIDVLGSFPLDAEEMARNTCHFGMNQDYEDLALSRRVLRRGTAPAGALLLGGQLNPLTINAIASLLSITFERYPSPLRQTGAEEMHQAEHLDTTTSEVSPKR